MIAASVLLTGCAMLDHGGYNSQEYYAANPRENRVRSETRAIEVGMDSPGKLSRDDRENLRDMFTDLSPKAVESVVLQTAPGDSQAMKVRRELEGWLTDAGLGQKIGFEQGEDAAPGDVMVTMTSLRVIGPRCPDWSQTSGFTFGNHWNSSMRCASTTNLGLMVEDPHDLVQGRGDANADTANATRAVEMYHNGAGGGNPLADLMGAMTGMAAGAASGGSQGAGTGSGSASGGGSGGGY